MRVICDPILKEIVVDSNALKVINTIAFQRLGRIKQTGHSIYTFPGLSQTRLQHSLGIYGIAQYLLRNNKSINKNLSKYEKTVLKYSALLHDIGHGPNSHFFERLTNVSHEKFTTHIIKHNSELNCVLKKIHKNLANDICKVIEKTHGNPILLQIISSHVDIDRMDYLMRDSYYSGLKRGSIDFRYILRNILIVNNKICFDECAVNSIENFLIARYHMYKSIYYNSKTHCYEWLIIKIVNRILFLYERGRIEKSNRLIKTYIDVLTNKNVTSDYPLDEYLKTDDILSIHF